MLFRSFLASSTSLALLAATTLVHAAVSPIAGLSPGESAARASQPEANISERDLLERARTDRKFVRVSRRQGHGHGGPRRMESREHGKLGVVSDFVERAAEAEKAEQPILVDANVLGKPLAVVDGAVNLSAEQLAKAVAADIDVSVLHKRDQVIANDEQTFLAPTKFIDSLDHPTVTSDIEIGVNTRMTTESHFETLKVGGLTLATLKRRTEQLALALESHIDVHEHADCSLDDVEQALRNLHAGVDAAIFRQRL